MPDSRIWDTLLQESRTLRRARGRSHQKRALSLRQKNHVAIQSHTNRTRYCEFSRLMSSRRAMSNGQGRESWLRVVHASFGALRLADSHVQWCWNHSTSMHVCADRWQNLLPGNTQLVLDQKLLRSNRKREQNLGVQTCNTCFQEMSSSGLLKPCPGHCSLRLLADSSLRSHIESPSRSKSINNSSGLVVRLQVWAKWPWSRFSGIDLGAGCFIPSFDVAPDNDHTVKKLQVRCFVRNVQRTSDSKSVRHKETRSVPRTASTAWTFTAWAGHETVPNFHFDLAPRVLNIFSIWLQILKVQSHSFLDGDLHFSWKWAERSQIFERSSKSLIFDDFHRFWAKTVKQDCAWRFESELNLALSRNAVDVELNINLSSARSKSQLFSGCQNGVTVSCRAPAHVHAGVCKKK